MVKSYKDLDVWRRSISIVKEVYLVTKKYPKEEIFTLVSQMRRAAISIPSNIAEGKSRHSKKEYIQFLYIALGSISELETQIMISKELDYIKNGIENDILDELDQIGKMLRSLINKLK
ncbi:MAG: four helix bundle protein [Candidatus Aureabacteria bacterium]|nr:four helix bundle protein [Candidatus Auribacterota bacterium]